MSIKCEKTEEAELFLRYLLKEGVCVPSDEEFLLSEEGRRKSKNLGEKGKKDLRNILTRGKLGDCVRERREHRKTRGRLRRELKDRLNVSQAKSFNSKVYKHCIEVRKKERTAHMKRIPWLIKKYRKDQAKEVLTT